MNKIQLDNIISEVDMDRPTESNIQVVKTYRIPVFWYQLKKLEKSTKFRDKIYVKALKQGQEDRISIGQINRYKQFSTCS